MIEDFIGGVADFDQSLTFQLYSYEAWNKCGEVLYKLGRNKEALASWDKVIEFKPDYHEAWNNRGLALKNLGRFEEAIASWDKAIEFKPDFHAAWYNRGYALDDLGRNEEAIASYDQAIEFKPDSHEAWNNRGWALYNLGRFEKAIASFDKAIEFKPDFHEAWYNRGVALGNLGGFEEAIASFNKAIEFKPDFHDTWFYRSMALFNLGQFEEAIASFDKAIEFKPDSHEACNYRGVALENLGRFEESIASLDKAIEFKPDFHYAWFNRGVALVNLGRFEESITSLDKAIEFKPDFHEAWYNRGNALDDLGRNQEAILSYDKAIKFKPDYYEAWNNRSVALKELEQFQEAIISLNQALAIKPDFYEALVNRGIVQGNLGDLEGAIVSYEKALAIKPDSHTSRTLDKTPTVKQLQRDNTDSLRRSIDQTQNPTEKKKCQLELEIFQQLTVDIAIRSDNLIEAIEIAEEGKNTYLYWLFRDNSSPKYPEIQQLLNPATAAVYWHLSPYALHTFIIKSGESTPIVIESQTESLTRVDKFEEWVKKWNQEYAKGKGEKQEGGAQTWRDNLPAMLKELGVILNIATIEDKVKGIKNLILIPHRDLHRFPIHALFGDEFIISYLPSAKLGLGLAEKQTELLVNEVKLLSIEHPESAGFDRLEYAQIESAAITALFPNSTRIQSKLVTQTALETALKNPHQILHFTGHATYNFNNPKLSYLALAGQEKITIENLLQLTLSNYQLVTLSACETAITGNQTITTEYVGLVSAFISRGVSYVVSTLWVVESAASALIMIKFYRLLNKGVSPPLALKKAQKWLRNLTIRQLIRLYQTAFAKLPDDQWRIRRFLEDQIDGYATIDSSEKLFTDHYHWSAFVITGLPHHLWNL